MKNNILLFLSSILCLTSCSFQEDNVIRISDQKYTIISDSIYSKLPGSIFYQDGIIYWHDAFSSDSFIHALDIVTKKEICSFGNIGNAPGDFSTPLLSLSPSTGFFINDAQKKLETLYRIDKEVDTLLVSMRDYTNIEKATRLLHLNDTALLYLCPGEDKPFCVNFNGKNIYGGIQPIEEKVTNGYDVFQGNILYNHKNNTLVFNSFRFPFLSVYQFDNQTVKLKAKLKDPIEFTISDSQLKLSKGVKEGAMELALTRKYIVTLQRDEMVEGATPPASYARDLSILPHSLFIYDYDLNLERIVNMPFPLLRLCGDIDNDTIYAIGVNPEFMIIKIDLGI